MTPLRLSLVVSTYNRSRELEMCLQSIRQSDYSNYELIVVDDGSSDLTRDVAARFADKIFSHRRNMGRHEARRRGFLLAEGDIIVNIDSDNLVPGDTLCKIAAFFQGHPNVDVVTGMLSIEHPNHDFLSQYKNLLLHYLYSRLPDMTHFVYGGIFAFRLQLKDSTQSSFKYAYDTELGHRFSHSRHKIQLLKDLQVVHLKHYTIKSFFLYSFLMAYHWALIFIKYRSWWSLRRHQVCVTHALNHFFSFRFLVFAAQKKGFLFSLASGPMMILDAAVKAAGLAAGFLGAAFNAVLTRLPHVSTKT